MGESCGVLDIAVGIVAFLANIGRSLAAVRAGWSLLREDYELIAIPLMTGGAVLACSAATFLVYQVSQPLGVVVAFPALFVCAFIAKLGHAAIVLAGNERLQGNDPTIRTAIAGAIARKGKLARWTLYALTVGVLIRILEGLLNMVLSIFGLLGQIVGSAVTIAADVTWDAFSYFVVSVMMFEDLEPPAAVKRSAELVRHRWGQLVIGQVSIGMGVVVLALPFAAVSAALWLLWPPLAYAVGGLAAVWLLSLGSALSAMFDVALYRFARDGTVREPFEWEDLMTALGPRATRKAREQK